MIPIKMSGIGIYLPQTRVSSADLGARLGVNPNWIERATGVRERRYASRETAVEMASMAARQAVRRADLAIEEIDLIVGASAIPQQLIPCTAALVQRELAIPDGKCMCFDVNATCLSFLVALQAVAPWVENGFYRNVLIVSSEIASVGLNHSEPESASLFGDAAVAVIVSRSRAEEESTFLHAAFETHSSGADLTVCLGGGSLFHPNKPTTLPEHNLFRMRGREVYRKAVGVIGPFLDRFFDKLPFEREQVDVVVPHQASRKGVELLTDRFGFRPEQVIVNLPSRGNCVAASIPLALGEGIEEGRIQRGHHVMMVGTGAGLTLGAIMIRY